MFIRAKTSRVFGVEGVMFLIQSPFIPSSENLPDGMGWFHAGHDTVVTGSCNLGGCG